MPDYSSWDVVFGADRGQIILGVDFPGNQRREARLSELARKLGSQYGFLQTKVPIFRTGRGISGAAYVDRWIDGIRDRPVAAVLGNRVGSVYAAAIADELARWQQAPRVILFNPQFAGTELLGYELHKEISVISSLLSDDEIERATKLAAEVAESEPEDFADTAARVSGFYWEISSVAFERVGIGGAYCSKSFAPFESYISLVSAAGQIDPSSTWKRSVAIVSSDYANLPNGPSPAGDTGTLIGRSIPFSVPHADLLRSDSVAKAVADLLELN
jgi:hypothetical protein